MSTSPLIGNIIIFVVCVGLNIAVVWQIVDGNAAETWQSFRGFPVWLQVATGIVLLPWLLALGIWQTDWALPVRLVLVTGILVFVLIVFFPKGISS